MQDEQSVNTEIAAILRDAKRPLNTRRILKALKGVGGFEEMDMKSLSSVLAQGRQLELWDEPRKSVFISMDYVAQNLPETHEQTDRRPRPSGGATRRDRRRRSRDNADDVFPAAPLTLEETAAMSAQADSRSVLYEAMWRRICRRASVVVGLEGEDESLDLPLGPESLGHTSPAEVYSPPVGRTGSMRGRRSSRDVANKDQPDGFPASSAPEIKAGPFLLPEGYNDDRVQYRERRQKQEDYAGAERRGGRGTDLENATTIARTVITWLRARGRPMSVDELASEMASSGMSTGGVRAMLVAENLRCSSTGVRGPFSFEDSGHIGLTEWGLSERYIELEQVIQRAANEQEELVRRALLNRVSELSGPAFSRLVILILQRRGLRDFEEIYVQDGGKLALTATAGDVVGGQKVVVIAQKSWSTIEEETVSALRESLGFFGANEGLIMGVGNFSSASITAAKRPEEANIRLIDGRGLADILVELGLGLSRYKKKFVHLSGSFFESLES